MKKTKAGNHATGKAKQDAGRMGRGDSAFERKVSSKWGPIQKRIDEVVAHAQIEGMGTMDEFRFAHRVRARGRLL